MQVHRRPLRLCALVLAHALGIAVIGLTQFAVTSTRTPGACAATAPPGDRLWWWVETRGETPLADLFDDHEVRRFIVTTASILALGALLGWIVWLMRPFRLSVRLRTIMVIVAVVPVECAGGAWIWDCWERWDRCQRLAGWEALMQEIARESAAENPLSEDQSLDQAETRE